jgi:hypothetical protein
MKETFGLSITEALEVMQSEIEKQRAREVEYSLLDKPIIAAYAEEHYGIYAYNCNGPSDYFELLATFAGGYPDASNQEAIWRWWPFAIYE